MGLSAAAYLRISADPSAGGSSVATQRAYASRVARDQGYDLPKERIITDTGSASRFGRVARGGATLAGWDALLAIMPSVDVVILAEIARSSRDMKVFVDLAEACIDHGVRLFAGGAERDLTRSTDLTITYIEVALGAGESARISERVKRGVNISVAEGRPPAGRTPFGYLRPPRELGVRAVQVPHPVNAHLVAIAARYLLAGGSQADIARWWNWALGVAYWTGGRVRMALQNPVIAALRPYRGTYTPAAWLPLVSAEDFYALAALFNAKRRGGGAAQAKSLLSGIAVCAVCEKTLVHQRSQFIQGVRQDVSKLRCPSGHISRDAEFVDDLVTSTVVDAMAADLRGRLVGRAKQPPSAPGTDVSALLADLARRREALSEFAAGAVREGLSPADAVLGLKAYRESVTNAEQAVKAVSLARAADSDSVELDALVRDRFELAVRAMTEAGAPDPVGAAGEMLFGDLVEDARGVWEESTIEAKRQLVRRHVTVTLLPIPRGRRLGLSPDYVRVERLTPARAGRVGAPVNRRRRTDPSTP